MTNERPIYTPGMPLELMKKSCMIRNNGKPCSLYEYKIEIMEGVEADVHYCHVNPNNCDFARGVAFALGGLGSRLKR